MKAVEFIIERMDTTWVQSWVRRSTPKQLPGNDVVNWFGSLFKSLNSDSEFKNWADTNVVGPIVIKPRLTDDEDVSLTIMDATHTAYNTPKHEVVVDINVSPVIDNEKKVASIVASLSGKLIHELNHSQQTSNRINKTDPDTALDLGDKLFRTKPPAPKNEIEKYYIYMIDSMEHDAWASEIAHNIKSALGNGAEKQLDTIFKQAEKEDYAVIGSKIIQLDNLNGLLGAIKYYDKYLKLGKEQLTRRIKREVYKYITQ